MNFKLRKVILCSSLALGLGFQLSAASDAKALVGEANYNKLLADSKNHIMYTSDAKDSKLTLMPKSPYSDKISSGRIAREDKNFSYLCENLYLLKKDFLLKQSGSSAKEISIDDVARVCRSVSKMQGMMYHSSTKKKDMVLYKKCYMISGFGSKDPIPDQNTGNADGQVSYCLQDDNSFGENSYKLSYFQKDDTLLMEFSILDKMGFLGVYPIKPGKMKITVLVTDCGDSLLLYLATDLDAENPMLVKKQIPESMGERMEAIYKWFIKQF
ncbi:MAG: hypothetical protein K5829_03590 [Treponema sp.]|nr:hypothetical protein [Treponema sp.]